MAKKRANGEGNIRKRKDGRWEGRYTAGHDPETGKAIYKNVLGRTQAEAKAKLKAAIEETKSLDVTKAGKYTVGAWMDEWFENYAKVKVRPSSHQTYRGYIDNHIKPNIGKIPLEKLTSLELQKLYKKLLTSGRIDRVESKKQAKGLSPKTVRNIHQIIASAMKLAKEQTDDRQRPHRGLRPAEAGTSGDENAARRATDLLPQRGKRERRVRDVLRGAGHGSTTRRITRPEVGGH